MNLEVQRRKEEFYCDLSGGGCSKYFSTYLRDNTSGSFTIRCPACGHDHYRKIVNGLVTSDRARDDKDVYNKIILGLKATLRDTPQHNSPEYRRLLMKRLK